MLPWWTAVNSPRWNKMHELIRYLPKPKQLEMLQLLKQRIWMPQAGPQLQALNTDADVLFYGGAAGGGKTDLLIGAALTRHRASMIFRREGTQHTAILDRMTELLGSRDGYNSQTGVWRLDGNHRIEFGACPHLGDEQRYQGRPHDPYRPCAISGNGNISLFPYFVIFLWCISANKSPAECIIIVEGKFEAKKNRCRTQHRNSANV